MARTMYDSMAYFVCPDCGTMCPFKFSVIQNDGSILHLTTCGTCKNRITMRVLVRLRTPATLARIPGNGNK